MQPGAVVAQQSAPGVAAAGYYPPPAAGPAAPAPAATAAAGYFLPTGGVMQQHAAPHIAAQNGGAPPPGAVAGGYAVAAGNKRPYEGGAADGYGATGYGAGADSKRQYVGQHPQVPAGAGAAVQQQQQQQQVAMQAVQQVTPATVPRESVYRVVLDVVDTALIIGRGGNTVRQIEQTTGGRVKRLQEPPGAREQVVVVWNSTKELPSAGRVARNTAQEALLDCVRRVVFQENAPMGQPMLVRMLINRTQEQGVLDNMTSIIADNPGTSMEFKRAQDLPPCALDNDVLIVLTGERYSLMAAVEVLSHVLREHPIMERPGGAPPALRALAGPAPTPAYGGGGAAYGRF